MLRRLIFTKIFLGLILYAPSAEAQKNSFLHHAEGELSKLSKEIQGSSSDTARVRLNGKFMTLLEQAVRSEGSFEYPFDSLRKIGKLKSPDSRFRIYNWNLPGGDGTSRYYCLLQVYDKVKKQYTCYSLSDISDTLEQPEKRRLTGDHWYGALYYKILCNKSEHHTYYTLLGWDNCSLLLAQKIIEVLSFDESGKPCFGARIFQGYGDGQSLRIIFRYSSSANMTLKYEEQFLPKEQASYYGQKKSSGKEKKVSMIIFDHLIPLDPLYENQYEYYIPEADICDGFVFLYGSWMFIRNIDARNRSATSGKKK
jgi:hypothetical protein